MTDREALLEALVIERFTHLPEKPLGERHDDLMRGMFRRAEIAAEQAHRAAS